MKSKVVILFYALISLIIITNKNKAYQNQFVNDSNGYYLYLPAIFIYHDLQKLTFYRAIDSEYHHNIGPQPFPASVNGNMLNKYTAGVACFEMPAFFIANFYCKFTKHYKADGYTLPYQYAGILSNIFWVLFGLFILRNFLKRYFKDNTVAVTLLCLAFGTNLYAYTCFEIGMSHTYSFFLFSCLLNVTDTTYKNRLYRKVTIFNYFLIGLIIGFIFLVRPINIICCLIPILWGINSLEEMMAKIKYYMHHLTLILVSFSLFLIVVFIQFSYWRYITGEWLFYSYIGEKFDFLHPNIIRGLFSYRKGWFIYTPIAFLGILGIGILHKKLKQTAFATIVFYLVFIFFIFSWQEWWYGGSFGCRPMIESLAVLSIPLACIVEYILTTCYRAINICFTFFIAIFIFLNIFQTYQYSKGIIHWDRMTKQYYWQVFGRLDIDKKAYEKYLLTESEEYKFD